MKLPVVLCVFQESHVGLNATYSLSKTSQQLLTIMPFTDYPFASEAI